MVIELHLNCVFVKGEGPHERRGCGVWDVGCRMLGSVVGALSMTKGFGFLTCQR